MLMDKHELQIQKEDEKGYHIFWGTSYSNPYSAWIAGYVESKPPYKATVSSQLLNTDKREEYRKSDFKKFDDAVYWCIMTISDRLALISAEISKYKIKEQSDAISSSKHVKNTNKRIK